MPAPTLLRRTSRPGFDMEVPISSFFSGGAGRAASSLDDADRVLPDIGITRDQDQVFHDRLRYEHPVERVLVMIRQSLHGERVSQRDRQRFELMSRHFAVERGRGLQFAESL